MLDTKIGFQGLPFVGSVAKRRRESRLETADGMRR